MKLLAKHNGKLWKTAATNKPSKYTASNIQNYALLYFIPYAYYFVGYPISHWLIIPRLTSSNT